MLHFLATHFTLWNFPVLLHKILAGVPWSSLEKNLVALWGVTQVAIQDGQSPDRIGCPIVVILLYSKFTFSNIVAITLYTKSTCSNIVAILVYTKLTCSNIVAIL